MWSIPEHYTPEHRSELQDLLDGQAWQEVLHGPLLAEVCVSRLVPPKLRGFIDPIVDQLVAFNSERVGDLVAHGVRDPDRLLDALGHWPPELAGNDPVVAFLGLNLTAECNFHPKCLYCNQPYVVSDVDLDGWKRVVEEATHDCADGGPYVYITGGEPLLLGDALWGDDGLVRYATGRGAGVNINTNGIAITPEVALRLIKAGTSKLHISLDTCDPELQDYLNGGEHFQQVLRGIHNIQIARDLVGVSYPVVHTNCVLTNRNLRAFPQLFAFLLDKHKQSAQKDDPLFNDLFPHVIPVGGAGNQWLRPTTDEFRLFYEVTWPEVCRLWDEYQDRVGVPKDKRGALFGYFSNPYLRVQHQGGLDAYVQAAAEGRYGKLALARHCYVAPTQASFTPDGTQYRCGAHAIRHTQPTGDIHARGVFASIRADTASLDRLPDEALCDGCALATLYINQAVEKKLREHVGQLLA